MPLSGVLLSASIAVCGAASSQPATVTPHPAPPVVTAGSPAPDWNKPVSVHDAGGPLSAALRSLSADTGLRLDAATELRAQKVVIITHHQPLLATMNAVATLL